MTPRHTRTLAAGLVLAAVAMTSACGPGVGEATNTSSPTSTTSTTSASSTTSTTSAPSSSSSPSPEDAAVKKAERVIPAYFKLKDRSLVNPKSFDENEFKDVTVSSALIEMKNLLSAAKAQDLKLIGSTSVVSVGNPHGLRDFAVGRHRTTAYRTFRL